MTERSVRVLIPSITLLILFSFVLGISETFASSGPRPVVRYASRSDTTAPLRELPQIPPMPAVLGEIFEKPLKALPNRAGSGGIAGPDEALQESAAQSGAPTTGADFEGVGNVNGVLPPDTVGDIGPKHYVQMTNLSFAIWDLTDTLIPAYGPVPNNTLWNGFGGPCESTNDGDPIVLYDEIADRWMMSQFALPRFPRGPFYQCIAVSQTGDPTGAWHRYEFLIHQDKLNDYPKFGVWPDGYYMSVNQFKCNPRRCSWEGQGVVAFERDEMLQGNAARMVYFDLKGVDPNLGGMLPADFDGPSPPIGAPNPFVQVDDGAWGYTGGQDQLQFWNFHVDWNNPSLSTFTFDRALATVAFDADLCGYSRNCIPQPAGGTPVDAISDRLMYRLQYRNFGSHETLVVNHTVDAGGDHAGIRWYEVRKSGGDWGIHQQGTYAPDADHRWMGSIAMNSAGDIALGYSVSSPNTSPSIRFTGRLAGDPLDQMTQGEGEIIVGSGYQTHSSGRWGDYSMMAVDPVDDCTFWYTQEYYSSIGVAPWQTRIGSFKLRDCGPVDDLPSVSIFDPVEGQTLTGGYRVLVSASDDGAVSKVELSIDGATPNDITANLDGSYYFYDWSTSGEDEGAHTLQALATDDVGQSIESAVINVTVDNGNDPPVASFSYSCTGLTCEFDGSGSSDSDGSITSYEWDFGDTTNGGSGETLSHPYAAAGTYTVVLTVTDNDGAPDTDSQAVTVSEPVAGVTIDGISPESMPAGRSLDVTITGSGFGPDATVSFENGSGPAPTATIISISADGTEITATITSKSGGPPRDRVWDVLVNSGGSTGVLFGGFTVTR